MSISIRYTKRRRKDEPALQQLVILLLTVSYLLLSAIYRRLKQVAYIVLSYAYDRLAPQEPEPPRARPRQPSVTVRRGQPARTPHPRPYQNKHGIYTSNVKEYTDGNDQNRENRL